MTEPQPEQISLFSEQKKKKRAPKVKKIAEKKVTEAKPPVTKFSWIDTMLGTVFIFFGIIGLVFSGYILYGKLFGPKPLAYLLPVESTIGFAEFDWKNSDTKKLHDWLSKYPAYQEDKLKIWINQTFNTDFETKVKPWLGGKIGLAFIKGVKPADFPERLLFIQNRSKAQTLDFFKSLKINDQDMIREERFLNTTVYDYTISQNIVFAFVNKYVVMANNKAALQSIITASRDPEKTVKNDPLYIEVANNLSVNRWGFGYVNIPNLIKFVLEKPEYFPRSWTKVSFLKPVLDILKSSGFSLAVADKGLIAQQYTAINKTTLRDQQFFHQDEKYRGHLLSLVEPTTEVLIGGINPQKEWQKMLEILNELHPAGQLIAEGILRSAVTKYFGEEVSLVNDFYPLMSDEYVLSMPSKDNFKLILKLPKPATDRVKINQLIDRFVATLNLSVPEIKEVKKPDGSTAQEIVPVVGQASRQEIDIEGQKVTEIKVSDWPYPIEILIIDDKLLLTNNLETMKSTINLNKNAAQNLTQSESYRAISKVIGEADEVSLVRTERLKNLRPDLAPYLEPFTAISSGKNVFDDGVSVIYFVPIK